MVKVIGTSSKRSRLTLGTSQSGEARYISRDGKES